MKRHFNRARGLLVFFAWLAVCLLGALPFYFSGFLPNFTDAVFESVSGFTTTGATVLADIEALPAWLLFWRSITQWLGGIGILVTVAMFPLFSAGGFQLLKTQTIGADGSQLVPRHSRAVRIILLVYAALTALQFALLVIFGMNWFDALTHAFSTVSTGGFSIRGGGVAYYNSRAVEWITIVFMFLAGGSFFLIWRLFSGKASAVTQNSEARAYAGIVLAAGIAATAAILPQSSSFGTAIRQAFFHVVSLISTSGFYSADYSKWPAAALGVLFLLLFIGGCRGSTAGGVKVIRYVILCKQAWNEMKRLVYPRGFFDIRLNGKHENKRAVHGIAGFVSLYFFTAFLAALLVSSGGADVFTSLNTAIICLGNTGLGVGEVGAFMPFPFFPAYIKWGLCLVMIAGRLELWIAALILTLDFWRR